nr:EOG090X0KVN [Chydorus sphaericus]
MNNLEEYSSLLRGGPMELGGNLLEYESKGKQWSKKPAYPVGMNPALIAAASTEKKAKKPKDDANKPAIPGLAPAAAKKKKSKPTKADSGVKEVSSKLGGFTIEEPTFGAAEKPHVTNNATPKVSQPSSNAADTSSSTDPAKRLKNVKKKLRDIEALEAKIKSGEVKNPDKDQLEKIKRKSEVVKEIKELEKIVK